MKIKQSKNNVTIRMTNLEYKGLVDMIATYPDPHPYKDAERFSKAFGNATVVKKPFSEKGSK